MCEFLLQTQKLTEVVFLSRVQIEKQFLYFARAETKTETIFFNFHSPGKEVQRTESVHGGGSPIPGKFDSF